MKAPPLTATPLFVSMLPAAIAAAGTGVAQTQGPALSGPWSERGPSLREAFLVDADGSDDLTHGMSSCWSSTRS